MSAERLKSRSEAGMGEGRSEGADQGMPEPIIPSQSGVFMKPDDFPPVQIRHRRGLPVLEKVVIRDSSRPGGIPLGMKGPDTGQDSDMEKIETPPAPGENDNAPISQRMIMGSVELLTADRAHQIALETRNRILAAGVHDINNLLVVLSELVRTLDDAMKDGRIVDSDVREAAEGVSLAVAQAISITDQCAFFNRAVALEKVPIKKSEIDLYAFLDNVLEQVKIPVLISNPKVIMALWTDPHQLARVIINLLNNVKYHAQSPGNEAEIIIDEVSNFTVIRIRDRGRGLGKDITGLFTQHQQEGRSIKGYGIGLAACKMVCEAHGGIIRGENNKDGPGAMFTIMIPKKEG